MQVVGRPPLIGATPNVFCLTIHLRAGTGRGFWIKQGQGSAKGAWDVQDDGQDREHALHGARGVSGDEGSWSCACGFLATTMVLSGAVNGGREPCQVGC